MTSRSRSRALAVGFLEMVTQNRDPRGAARMYLGRGFVHHHPFLKGDMDSLIYGMEEAARANPGMRLDIKHVVVDHDLVAVHSHLRMRLDDPGIAVVHLFRIDGDRIVEFWDVSQIIPGALPNQHGMF